ncbi:MAG TPA: cytochrome c [Cytophagales bacterium]|nr:cytochrome c [Cytophagales bacterium]
MIKISIAAILFILNLPLLINSEAPKTILQTPAADLQESIKKGKTVFSTYCIACHQENGLGMEGVFPPLAKSDYLLADTKRAIKVVMHGMSGEITVNGKKYNSQMPDFGLNDEQIKDVVNYIQNSWGNKGKAVTLADVKAVRAAKK